MATKKEIVLELSKDQVQSILKFANPFRTEDNIRVSFIADNIVFEMEEIGNTGRLTMGSPDVKAEFVGDHFFLSKAILSSIYQNMPNVVKFTFRNDGEQWVDFTVNIGGDEINAGLSILEKEINNDYKVKEQENILSEILSDAIVKTSTALVKEADPLGVIEMGETMNYGSIEALSMYKDFLKTLKAKVTPSFRGYLSNICKFGGTVTIINTEAGEVVVKCENVEYKTYSVNHQIRNLEEVVPTRKVMFRAGIENLNEAISRLSIPLMGANSELFMTVKDKTLTLEVFDIQNRRSESKITLTGVENEGKASALINTISSVIGSFQSDATIEFRTTDDEDDGEIRTLVIEDSKMKTYVMTVVD